MNILVVDDEIKACELLHMILTDMGYKVTIADRGTDALELARKKQYDFLFLDINMPDKSGIEVIQTLRKENNPIKIIVVSAVDNEIAKKYIKEQGVDGYIVKPYKIDILKGAIEKALKKIK